MGLGLEHGVGRFAFCFVFLFARKKRITLSMRRIEFSGCDGSGKTSALQRTQQYLLSRDYKVLCSREVGNPHIPACVELRRLMLSPVSNLSDMSIELVCAAMRIENERFYKAMANEVDVLLSDRGYLDHLAYGDINCDPAFTKELFDDCVAKYTSKPDLVFYFNVDIEEARRRRGVRNQAVDVIEAKGDDFQRKVAERFMHHISSRSLSVHIIDANQSEEEVFKQIVEVLNNFFH